MDAAGEGQFGNALLCDGLFDLARVGSAAHGRSTNGKSLLYTGQ